jgi:hypothetical protein
MAEEIDPRIPSWANRLLNRRPFLVPEESVATVAIGYGASDSDPTKPNWRSLRIGQQFEAMFMNAPVFVRVTSTIDQLLFGAISSAILWELIGPRWWYGFLFGGWFLYVRYSPTVTGQIGWGHKLNGRWTILCRPWHHDKKSAEGTLGPNLGQQTGWQWGPH